MDEFRDPRSPVRVPRVPHQLAAPEELVYGATAMDGFARAGQRRDVVLTRRTTVPHEFVAHQLVVIPWPDAVSAHGRAQTRSLGFQIPS